MREYLGNRGQFQRAIHLRKIMATEDDEFRKMQRIIKLSGVNRPKDKCGHTRPVERQFKKKNDNSTNVFNIDLFQKRMKSFPQRYMENFDYFWKWKIKNEKENIFINYTLTETHFRLSKILNSARTRSRFLG